MNHHKMTLHKNQMTSLATESNAQVFGERDGVVLVRQEPGHPMRNLVIEIPADKKEHSKDSLMKNTFLKYATKGAMMDIQGLSRCMYDFGLLDGRPAQESRDAVVAMFASLDIKKKNRINMNEFARIWAKINAPRLGDVISTEDPALETALFESFCSWSTFGSPRGPHIRLREDEIMGSSHWNKLCRDVGLVPTGGHEESSGCVSFSDVDLMFAKVKARGKRRINFSQFIDALGLMAEKLGSMDVMDVAQMIVQCKPMLNGTVVSTPTFCPSTARYNIFERNLGVSPKSVPCSCATPTGENSPPVKKYTWRQEEEMLLHVYGQYARFGRRSKLNTVSDIQMSMSDQQFTKLCRECGIATRNMPLVKMDLIFAKAKKAGKNSLLFEDFLVALSMIASEVGVEEQSIYALVCRNTSGPRIHSPKADTFVRLHDDPSTQCGVYGRRNAR